MIGLFLAVPLHHELEHLYLRLQFARVNFLQVVVTFFLYQINLLDYEHEHVLSIGIDVLHMLGLD